MSTWRQSRQSTSSRGGPRRRSSPGCATPWQSRSATRAPGRAAGEEPLRRRVGAERVAPGLVAAAQRADDLRAPSDEGREIRLQDDGEGVGGVARFGRIARIGRRIARQSAAASVVAVIGRRVRSSEASDMGQHLLLDWEP